MTSSSIGHEPERFPIVRRGYPPEEVDDYAEQLERALKASETERNEFNERISLLKRQLSAAEAEASDLRSELDRQASEPLNMAGLSGRMQRLLEVAEEEAAELRAESDKYSADAREKADADAQRVRREAEHDAAKSRSELEAETARTRSEMDAEVAAAREDIAHERSELNQTRTALYDQAKRLMTEAHAEADKTLTDAREQAEHLSAAAADDRAKQEQDYELAIESRRRQARRAIAEAEEAARADATDRINQATTHARNVVQSANAHVDDLLRRAATESHQRVAEADEAVRKLVNLRAKLQQQIVDLSGHLSDLSGMMTTVRQSLDPIPLENNRPDPADFPSDPTKRSSNTTAFAAAPTEWHPPIPPIGRGWDSQSAAIEGAPDKAPPQHDRHGTEPAASTDEPHSRPDDQATDIDDADWTDTTVDTASSSPQ